MFYNYLKLIYSFIKDKNLPKIQKINKINNSFLNLIKSNHIGGSDIQELQQVDNSVANLNEKFKIIFEDIIGILKTKTSGTGNFSDEQLLFLKKTLTLLKNLIDEIENIKNEDIEKLKSDLEEINKVLIDLIGKINET